MYNLDFTAFFVALVIAGIAIGVGLMFLAPWLWSLIRPWLHMVTA